MLRTSNTPPWSFPSKNHYRCGKTFPYLVLGVPRKSSGWPELPATPSGLLGPAYTPMVTWQKKWLWRSRCGKVFLVTSTTSTEVCSGFEAPWGFGHSIQGALCGLLWLQSHGSLRWAWIYGVSTDAEMFSVILILETLCPVMQVWPRELSPGPAPQGMLWETVVFIIRVWISVFKTMQGETKNQPLDCLFRGKTSKCWEVLAHSK